MRSVGDAGRVGRDEEDADALLAGLGVNGLGADLPAADGAAVGDEALRAVYDPLVAVEHGGGGDGAGVGAAGGLRVGHAHELALVHYHGEEAVYLLLVGEAQQLVGVVGAVEDGGKVVVVLGGLDDEHEQGGHALAEAAVLLGGDEAGEAELGHAVAHPNGVLIDLVEFLYARGYLLLDKLVEQIEVHFLVFGEFHLNSPND